MSKSWENENSLHAMKDVDDTVIGAGCPFEIGFADFAVTAKVNKKQKTSYFPRISQLFASRANVGGSGPVE